MFTHLSLLDKVRSTLLTSTKSKYLLILLLLGVMLAGTASVALTAPHSQTIPTIDIVSVDRDDSVTIRTHNFPANRAFTVMMGPYGTLGLNGTVVATTDSGAGGSFDATYQIPEALYGATRIAIRLQSPDGYSAYNWFYNNTTGGTVPSPPPGSGYWNIPTFSIKSVVADESVTVQTSNFPANRDFVVTMGPYGTRGINGTVVDTVNSGEGGSFEATFAVPDGLDGSYRIAIRMYNASGGYYAYNWFYNNTTGTGTGDGGTGGGTQPPTGYWQIPTFSIESVVADESVTVQTSNFPANRDFVVTMGAYGTRGINGTVVETINSGEGGSFEATFAIPEVLDGSYRIAIRMASQTGGYYAYNWFYNNTTGTGTGDGGTGGGQQPPGGYTGIPTFSIASVVRNESVTVQTNNFPANRDFVVTMGAYGTRGINGTVVETINSGEGGSFQATLPIPDGLDNSYRIAIRMASQTGGFYAYNWFFNNTTP